MNVNWYQDQRYWLHGVEGDHLSTVWMSLDPAPAKKLYEDTAPNDPGRRRGNDYQPRGRSGGLNC